MKKTYALIVLDGFGLSDLKKGNAVKLAKTPNYDLLKKEYPFTKLKAHGESVGLFKNQMGNSEVGHLNLGAGRIVLQESKKISNLITSGEFFNNKKLKQAFNTKGNVHIMGLLSDGGVHSSLHHLFALIDMAKKQQKNEVYLHLFTDGRDSSPTASINFIKKLQAHLNKVGIGKIASLVGRYYAMDRNNNYDRTKKAYDMLVFNKATNYASDPVSALKNSHNKNVTDEFIKPTIIKQNETVIKNEDSVIFYNYRGDRARQLSNAFTNNEFNEFKAVKFSNLNFVSLTQYDKNLQNVKVAFEKQNVKNTLGEVLAKNNKTQLRIAETTKYAHVTYFFNGGKEKPNKNEDRILVPTKDVTTFDKLPEMSINEIVNQVKNSVKQNKYNFVLINFANCDMVAHSGNLSATIKAVEATDKALGEVINHFKSINASVIVTADHGNAEKMITKDNNIHTAHTLNTVPFILIDNDYKSFKLKKDGKISDVSATILDLMQVKKPKEFTANSLIVK
jgi:2,3-bisphosphoglycerate-independent phosphoglycerate mutase